MLSTAAWLLRRLLLAAAFVALAAQAQSPQPTPLPPDSSFIGADFELWQFYSGQGNLELGATGSYLTLGHNPYQQGAAYYPQELDVTRSHLIHLEFAVGTAGTSLCPTLGCIFAQLGIVWHKRPGWEPGGLTESADPNALDFGYFPDETFQPSVAMGFIFGGPSTPILTRTVLTGINGTLRSSTPGLLPLGTNNTNRELRITIAYIPSPIPYYGIAPSDPAASHLKILVRRGALVPTQMFTMRVELPGTLPAMLNSATAFFGVLAKTTAQKFPILLTRVDVVNLETSDYRCQPDKAIFSTVVGKHYALCTGMPYRFWEAEASAKRAGGRVAELATPAALAFVTKTFLSPCTGVLGVGGFVGTYPRRDKDMTFMVGAVQRKDPTTLIWKWYWKETGVDVQPTLWGMEQPDQKGRTLQFPYQFGDGIGVFSTGISEGGAGGYLNTFMLEDTGGQFIPRPENYYYLWESANSTAPDPSKLCGLVGQSTPFTFQGLEINNTDWRYSFQSSFYQSFTAQGAVLFPEGYTGSRLSLFYRSPLPIDQDFTLHFELRMGKVSACFLLSGCNYGGFTIIFAANPEITASVRLEQAYPGRAGYFQAESLPNDVQFDGSVGLGFRFGNELGEPNPLNSAAFGVDGVEDDNIGLTPPLIANNANQRAMYLNIYHTAKEGRLDFNLVVGIGPAKAITGSFVLPAPMAQLPSFASFPSSFAWLGIAGETGQNAVGLSISRVDYTPRVVRALVKPNTPFLYASNLYGDGEGQIENLYFAVCTRRRYTFLEALADAARVRGGSVFSTSSASEFDFVKNELVGPLMLGPEASSFVDTIVVGGEGGTVSAGPWINARYDPESSAFVSPNGAGTPLLFFAQDLDSAVLGGTWSFDKSTTNSALHFSYSHSVEQPTSGGRLAGVALRDMDITSPGAHLFYVLRVAVPDTDPQPTAATVCQLDDPDLTRPRLSVDFRKQDFNAANFSYTPASRDYIKKGFGDPCGAVISAYGPRSAQGIGTTAGYVSLVSRFEVDVSGDFEAELEIDTTSLEKCTYAGGCIFAEIALVFSGSEAMNRFGAQPAPGTNANFGIICGSGKRSCPSADGTVAIGFRVVQGVRRASNLAYVMLAFNGVVTFEDGRDLFPTNVNKTMRLLFTYSASDRNLAYNLYDNDPALGLLGSGQMSIPFDKLITPKGSGENRTSAFLAVTSSSTNTSPLPFFLTRLSYRRLLPSPSTTPSPSPSSSVGAAASISPSASASVSPSESPSPSTEASPSISGSTSPSPSASSSASTSPSISTEATASPSSTFSGTSTGTATASSTATAAPSTAVKIGLQSKDAAPINLAVVVSKALPAPRVTVQLTKGCVGATKARLQCMAVGTGSSLRADSLLFSPPLLELTRDPAKDACASLANGKLEAEFTLFDGRNHLGNGTLSLANRVLSSYSLRSKEDADIRCEIRAVTDENSQPWSASSTTRDSLLAVAFGKATVNLAAMVPPLDFHLYRPQGSLLSSQRYGTTTTVTSSLAPEDPREASVAVAVAVAAKALYQRGSAAVASSALTSSSVTLSGKTLLVLILDLRSSPFFLSPSQLRMAASTSTHKNGTGSALLSAAAELERRASIGSLPGPLLSLSVFVGRIRANITFVSDDAQQLHVLTPSFQELCGNSTKCGYQPIRLLYEPYEPARDGGRQLQPSSQLSSPPPSPLLPPISCPPFCPSFFPKDQGTEVVPVAAITASGEVIMFPAAQAVPVDSSGEFTAALPPSSAANIIEAAWASATASGSTSLSSSFSPIFYSSTCAGFTSDLTRCLNASDPAFSDCAFGEGDSCRPCPRSATGQPSAICPGGARAWPLPGYSTTSEGSGVIIACEPPALERCLGFDPLSSTVICGEGYSSAHCSSCSRGWYFREATKRCQRCPVSTLPVGPIVRAAAAFVGILFLVLGFIFGSTFLLAKLLGGTVAGGWYRALDLLVWIIVVLQTLAAVGRSASPGLPPYISELFTVLQALQLQDIALPSACWDLYPFSSEVALFTLVLFLTISLWLWHVDSEYGLFHSAQGVCCCFCNQRKRQARRLSSKAAPGDTVPSASKNDGRMKRLTAFCVYFCGKAAAVFSRYWPVAAFSAGTLLYALTAESVFKLLNCTEVTVSALAWRDLDKDATANAGTIATTELEYTVRVLQSNRNFVCFQGSHRAAAALAILTLLVFVVGFPLSSLFCAKRKAKQVAAEAFGRANSAVPGLPLGWSEKQQELLAAGSPPLPSSYAEAEAADKKAIAAATNTLRGRILFFCLGRERILLGGRSGSLCRRPRLPRCGCLVSCFKTATTCLARRRTAHLRRGGSGRPKSSSRFSLVWADAANAENADSRAAKLKEQEEARAAAEKLSKAKARLVPGNFTASILDSSDAVSRHPALLHFTGNTFRASALEMRQIDAALLAVLALLQVYWSPLTSPADAAGRGAVNVAVLLSVAFYCATRRPFLRGDGWKLHTKLGSLLLAALAAVLTNANSALDLRFPSPSQIISPQDQEAYEVARQNRNNLSMAVFLGSLLLFLVLAVAFWRSTIEGARLEAKAIQARQKFKRALRVAGLAKQQKPAGTDADDEAAEVQVHKNPLMMPSAPSSTAGNVAPSALAPSASSSAFGCSVGGPAPLTGAAAAIVASMTAAPAAAQPPLPERPLSMSGAPLSAPSSTFAAPPPPPMTSVSSADRPQDILSPLWARKPTPVVR